MPAGEQERHGPVRGSRHHGPRGSSTCTTPGTTSAGRKVQHVLTGAYLLSQRTPGRMRRCPPDTAMPAGSVMASRGYWAQPMPPPRYACGAVATPNMVSVLSRAARNRRRKAMCMRRCPKEAMPAGSAMASRGHSAQPMPPPVTPAAPSPRRTWSACCPAQTGTAAGRRCACAAVPRKKQCPQDPLWHPAGNHGTVAAPCYACGAVSTPNMVSVLSRAARNRRRKAMLSS